MLELAICDDDPKAVERLKCFIEAFALQNEVSFHVTTFSDGAALIQAHRKFDFIFLDVEMEGMNGIETAQELRREDHSVPLVYVTNYADFQSRAFKVHAFDFIVKPFIIDDIFQVLRDFLDCLTEKDSKMIPLITPNGVVMQSLHEICCFCILEKKTVQVNTIYKSYIVKENLSDIYAKLDPNQFYMTHKSCIANLRYVESIEKGNGIILHSGIWIPLSQRRQKDFLYRLSQQLPDRSMWR